MKTIVIKSLGQWFKFKGYKVGKVEEMIGVATGYFSRITDFKNIPFSVAYKLSIFLDVNMEELYDLLCEED